MSSGVKAIGSRCAVTAADGSVQCWSWNPGDGTEGEEVTANVRTLADIPDAGFGVYVVTDDDQARLLRGFEQKLAQEARR